MTTRYQSMSDPSKSYEIDVGEDGLSTCTCPSFTYSRREIRGCKHIDALVALVATEPKDIP
ncbi:MAG: hypothetical protein NVSMB21_25530 [Vulcanimicrobiaceae bacterium]